MAKLYQLVLEIQGGVDKAFGDSIAVAQKHLQRLDKEVKDIAKGQKNISPIQNIYADISKEADAATREIATMNRTINDLTAYKKLKDANIEVGHAILASRREARSLDEQYKGTKLPEHAVKLKAAQNEVKKLEKEYTKNKKSLTALDEKIKNAGIDTKDLDVLFAKLREQINKTAEAQEKYKNAMAGLAKIKFNVTQVSKNFKSVAVNLFNGVKLFVKGVSAIAGASLLAVNSMAKQGG